LGHGSVNKIIALLQAGPILVRGQC